MGLKIVFVCTGNTCRSPLAEGLARGIFPAGTIISSAGIDAWNGDCASEETLKILLKNEIDLTEHKARRVTKEIVKEADWIVPMTKAHEARLKAEYFEEAHKIKRLGDWTENGKDVSDPWGGSAETYEKTAEEIEQLLRAMRDKLFG